MKHDSIAAQPVIRAERFVLRPVRQSDAGLLNLYAGDLRVARFTRSLPHPMPPGATEAFIARAQNGERSEDVWVMDGAERGLSEVLGVIALNRMDRNQSEIGYWVAPAFWNTGIASEAVGALIAANPQKADTIFAEVFQDNPGSARVLTNAGFDYIGDAEAYSVAREAKVATWTYLKRLV
ncbi:RimJ/RimL family protein N-acetyltransferase [Rhodovulum bhavnagarense]|uniref:RimJ/RimL family protein N-acetyltransferase n=1 Tax=Rhodovulum bhavnagarense TaxID=992286 RepID=A0A4R2RB30_9RHOB|nr:GNAT family N-acetyltransferase [Rhodovulum bhavnagarense]TCP60522.1 RimJ/RimL family protein N-acetyltransferase [Rhodovulum bhavnagarense]